MLSRKAPGAANRRGGEDRVSRGKAHSRRLPQNRLSRRRPKNWTGAGATALRAARLWRRSSSGRRMFDSLDAARNRRNLPSEPAERSGPGRRPLTTSARRRGAQPRDRHLQASGADGGGSAPSFFTHCAGRAVEIGDEGARTATDGVRASEPRRVVQYASKRASTPLPTASANRFRVPKDGSSKRATAGCPVPARFAA